MSVTHGPVLLMVGVGVGNEVVVIVVGAGDDMTVGGAVVGDIVAESILNDQRLSP